MNESTVEFEVKAVKIDLRMSPDIGDTQGLPRSRLYL